MLPCGQRQPQWVCHCACGKRIVVRGVSLRTGVTKSCGCLKTEMDAERILREQKAYIQRKGHGPGFKHGEAHGKNKTRLYRIWLAMKNRCNNPKGMDYDRYGGRGVKVCEEWENDYAAFRDWAQANGYRGDLSIDRIDNDGNYEPENCRWATAHEQRINQSRMKN